MKHNLTYSLRENVKFTENVDLTFSFWKLDIGCGMSIVSIMDNGI